MVYIISISEKLEIILNRQNVSKKELAEKLGVAQSTVSKKFKYNNWRELDVYEICKILDVKCEMVFTLKDGTKV